MISDTNPNPTRHTMKFTVKKYPSVPNRPEQADARTLADIQNLWYAIVDNGKYITGYAHTPNGLRFNMPQLGAYVQCTGDEETIIQWFNQNYYSNFQPQ